MDKTLQDLAWSVLPKEFKEEVKKIYCTPGHRAEVYTLLQNLFGAGNLASDAEVEEMLCCEKSKVIKLYKKCQKDGTFTCLYAAGVLDTLFGSKCLPDELTEDNFAKSEPKPAEPKFKLGDKVKDISSPHDGGIYKVDDIKKSSNGFIYHIQGLIGKSNVKESDLEPYTEPTFADERQSQCKKCVYVYF